MKKEMPICSLTNLLQRSEKTRPLKSDVRHHEGGASQSKAVKIFLVFLSLDV
jgi:hypothetical protein